MFCFKLKHLTELAENRGVIAAQNSEIKALRAELDILNSEKRDLLDWLLVSHGAPALYNKPEPHPLRAAELAPSPEQRLRRNSKARDWVEEAERLEMEAFQTSQSI
jgi:hypothetical protein